MELLTVLFALSLSSPAWALNCSLENGVFYADANSGAYGVQIGSIQWLQGAGVSVHIEGQWYSSEDGSMTLQNHQENQTALVLSYLTSTKVPVVAVFGCDSDRMVSFSLGFPEGAQNVNTSKPKPPPTPPVYYFPAFSRAKGTVAGSDAMGHLMHSGIWTMLEWWGFGLENANNVKGGGPLYLYNATAPWSDVLILCASDDFHTMEWTLAKDIFALGTYGSVRNLDVGYVGKSVMFAGTKGVTDAVYEWGRLMRTRFNTTRLQEDVVLNKLSWWTDNGAAYYYGYWSEHCGNNCSAPNATSLRPDQILLQEREWQEKAGLTVGINQLDTWWVPADADANGKFVDWVPRQDMFPNGIQEVSSKMPLLLYAWIFVNPEHGNRIQNYTWETAFDGVLGEVRLDQTLSFYRMLRDRFLTYGGTSFEQDNMLHHETLFEQVTNATGAVAEWWKGFATPWCESSIPVQICESRASDILESLRYPCVTNSRDNIDNVPGPWSSSQPNFADRWHVGFDRPFLWAMGIAPSFDNVWTKSSMPNTTWGNLTEDYVEMAMALSVLGGGVVGYGDAVNNTNVTLLRSTITSDGTILRPSQTTSYLDLVYLPPSLAPFDISVGRVFQAPSLVNDTTSASERFISLRNAPSDALFTTLLAVDLTSPLHFLPHMHSPPLQAPSYLALPFDTYALVNSNCATGQPTTTCASRFSSQTPLTLNTNGVAPTNNTHNSLLYSISPESCGPSKSWTLLGEIDKFVRVSPIRFSNLKSSCTPSPALQFDVHVRSNETVQIALSTPQDRITRLSLSTPGIVSVSCAQDSCQS